MENRCQQKRRGGDKSLFPTPAVEASFVAKIRAYLDGLSTPAEEDALNCMMIQPGGVEFYCRIEREHRTATHPIPYPQEAADVPALPHQGARPRH